MPTINITNGEKATIISALRFFQKNMQHLSNNHVDHIKDEATCGEQFDALNEGEINELIDALGIDIEHPYSAAEIAALWGNTANQETIYLAA